VTRKPANDIDDSALQLVMGHEIAHQGQELQADVCSIRSMLSAGTDPLKARAEYLRKRRTQETPDSPSPKPLGLGFSEHPEDKERDQFFLEAYQYHSRKKQVMCSGSLAQCAGQQSVM
jgi:predicted Zn-dependent protease